ncbi:hypothetical protein V8E36_005370 [Tilletia maclaganii]
MCDDNGWHYWPDDFCPKIRRKPNGSYASSDEDIGPERSLEAPTRTDAGGTADLIVPQGTGNGEKASGGVKASIPSVTDDLETESEPYSTESEPEEANGFAAGGRGIRSGGDHTEGRDRQASTVATGRTNTAPMKLDEWLAQSDAARRAQEDEFLLDSQLPRPSPPERPDFTALPTDLEAILDGAVTRAATILEDVKVDNLELAWRRDMWATGLALIEAICKIRNDDNYGFTAASWKREIARGWAVVGLNARKADDLQKEWTVPTRQKRCWDNRDD